MKRLKITFLFCCLFGKMMAQDCLLLQTENLDSLITFVEKKYEGSWRLNYLKSAKGGLKDSIRKEKANHLYSYARQFLKKKLSEEMICKRVGITDPGFIKVSDEKIQMGFIFYYDENNHSANIYNPKIIFSSNLKSGKVTASYSPSNKLIPNCKDFPDSCKFLVHNVVEAFEYAKEKGIIPKSYHNNYVRKTPPPYHFSLPYGKEKDCMKQCIFLNMYTGDTIISKPYKREGCVTFSEHVELAEFIIEGRVRSGQKEIVFENNGFELNEIEVLKVFKGDIEEPVLQGLTREFIHDIEKISLGGSGNVYIFFLRDDFPRLNLKGLDSLTFFPVYWLTRQPITIYDLSGNSGKIHSQIEKGIYQKIEKYTKQDRRIVMENETRHPRIKRLLYYNPETRMVRKFNIPDRKNGLFFFCESYLPKGKPNNAPVKISICGSNRHSYIDSFQLEVMYNPKAFGKRLVSSKKLNFEILKNPWNPLIDYNFKLFEKSDSSFIISAKKKGLIYLQVPPAGLSRYENGLPLLDLFFPILSENEPANIKITPVGETNAVDLKTGKSEKYDYVFCSRPLDKPASEYWEPIIDDFFPAEARIGDTVTIQGKYLKDSQIEIYGKTGRDIWFRGSVAPRYVVAQSNSEIKFIIPEKLENSNFDRKIMSDEALTPATGTILLYKKQNLLKTYTRRKSLKIIE